MLVKQIKNKSKIIITYLVLFFAFDILYSNFIYKENLKYNCYKYSKNFHYLQKNCKAKEKWIKNAVAYNVFTDDDGFRFQGKDSKKKTSNIAVFLGDSFTYGMGLEYEETFVGIIDKKKENYLIKNLGVQGYSPSVYLYQLTKLKKENILPRKIFVVLDLSDVFEEASIWKNDNSFEHPVLIKERSLEEIDSKISFKEKNFKASRFIARKINNFFRKIRIMNSKKLKSKKIPGNSYWGNFIHTDLSDTDQTLWNPIGFSEALKKIEINFIKMSEITKDINAELYIIIYPWPDTLYKGQSKFNWEKYSSNLCSLSKCKKLISLFPEFQDIMNNHDNWLTKIFIAGDLHITPFGQKVIAKKILEEGFNK